MVTGRNNLHCKLVRPRPVHRARGGGVMPKIAIEDLRDSTERAQIVGARSVTIRTGTATAILDALDECWKMEDSHRLTPEAYVALRVVYGEEESNDS